MPEKKQPQKSFPLRLPRSMRLIADDLAEREGISLNQFISLAIAEKITRLESQQSGDKFKPQGVNAKNPHNG